MKNLKKKYIIIGILILLVLGMVALYKNVTYGKETLIFTTSPAENTLATLMKSTKSGESVTITAAEINGILDMYSQNYSNINDNIEIEKILCGIDENIVSLYFPAKIYGLKALVSLQSGVTYKDNSFILTPSNLKLGKVNLPINFVLSKLSNGSNDNFEIKDNSIIISSKVLPIDISKFEMKDSSINLAFAPINLSMADKEDNQDNQDNQDGRQTKVDSSKTKKSATISKEEARKKELQTVNYQLNKVLKAVENSEEKAIISTIQSVVKKMIADPNYAYQSEANAVKARYSKLSAEQKSNIKNAILMNMSMSSLRNLNSTFHLL